MITKTNAPEPGRLDAVEAADHRDHEHVDHRAEIDRGGVDVPVPPDEQDAAERRDERREAERECAVEHDVVAQRAHPDRVVAHSLERETERSPHDVAQQQR